MKRVGLCTCYDNHNYGSMLQALATQIIIIEQGYICEIIRYEKKYTLWFIIKSIPRLFNPLLVSRKLRKIKRDILVKKHPEIMVMHKQRKELLNSFCKTHFTSLSPVLQGYAHLVDYAERYDAVVVGSDQLWLPSGLASKFYTLMFVPDHVQKVSYATSFGVSKIPFFQIRRTREYLRRINCISVREIRGKEIIEELTGRTAAVAADPTLLLGAVEWEAVFQARTIVEGPYILCYFLGTNIEHRKAVIELGAKTGCKTVSLPFMNEFNKVDVDFGDEQLYNIAPGDFINLVRGAQYICTDSFHGTIFSILHHKQFIVFNRYQEGAKYSRNSRIDSLCTRLQIEERRYNQDIVTEMQREIDYETIDRLVEEFRRESLEFLCNALSG